MKTTTKIGISGSTVWLTGWIAYACFQWHKVSGLEPNAVGDFLAGVSAPLALFWLVLGYFQQGEELSQNTIALRAQQEELRKQVEQTEVLAKHYEKQAHVTEQMFLASRDEAQREETRALEEARAIFAVVGTTGNNANCVCRIENRGKGVRELKAETDEPGIFVQVHNGTLVTPGQIAKLNIQNATRFPFNIRLVYIDAYGKQRVDTYQVRGLGQIALV